MTINIPVSNTKSDALLYLESAHTVSAVWCPLYLEPMVGSGERICFGVLVGNVEEFLVVPVAAIDYLNSLYGRNGDFLRFVVSETISSLQRAMQVEKRRRDFYENRTLDSLWVAPFDGVLVGNCTRGKGETIEEIAQVGIALCASLVALNFEESVQPLINISALEVESEIRNLLKGRFPQFEVYFNVARHFYPHTPEVPFGFIGNRLAANFSILDDLHLSESVKHIKAKLWDLSNLRDYVLSNPVVKEQQEQFEMLVYRPKVLENEHTELQNYGADEAIEQLLLEAKNRGVGLYYRSSFDDLSHRVIECELGVIERTDQHSQSLLVADRENQVKSTVSKLPNRRWAERLSSTLLVSEASLAEVPVAEASTHPSPEGRIARQPSMAQVMELDEFAAFMAGADALGRGALLKGTVVRREDNGSVLIDVGGKSEGIIYRNELGEDEINVGDEVEVVVVRPEDDEGHPILSKRRADFERVKREIAEAKETGAIRQATVRESVKGGLLVDLLGVSAFVPASHVDIRNRSDLARLVGRTIPVRVIEVDFKKNRDKVIASHRLAEEEVREKRETEVWTTLEKDKIVEGIVRRITDFGAFVDIGGIDGLLHVREMAWGRVEHPSQVVKKGQKLQVLILELDEERMRVVLGLKQLLPDPWKKAAKNFRVGQTVKGKVVRLAEACAFVELEPGVEAIVPISELSEERIKTPDEAVQVGQEVEGRIKSIQSNVRRITMSLRAAVAEKEWTETRAAVRQINDRTSDDGPLRLGDLFGNELRAARDRGKERNRSREEARAQQFEEADVDDDDFTEDEGGEDIGMNFSAYSASALSNDEESVIAISEPGAVTEQSEALNDSGESK